MPIDAIALLPITSADIAAVLGAPEVVEGDTIFQSPRGPIAVQAIDDGSLVSLGIGFGAEPDDIGMHLRVCLGTALGDLSEAYVFPDVTTPRKTTVAGILEELGEGGMQVRVPTVDQAGAAMKLGGAETADLFGAMQGLLGGDLLANVQAALSDPDGGDAMESLAAMAKSLLQDDSIRAAVQDTAAKLQAGGALDGIDPGALMGGGGGLLEQAKSIAAKVAEKDPALMEELAANLSADGKSEEE